MGQRAVGLTAEPTSFVDLLRQRSREQPERRAFTFLAEVEGDAEEHLSYGALDLRARGLAAYLQAAGLSGRRALLLYPPGVEFITAYFGCLYAGVVAVPAHLPR